MSLIKRQASSGFFVSLNSSVSKLKFRNAIHVQYVLKQIRKYCCICDTDSNNYKGKKVQHVLSIGQRKISVAQIMLYTMGGEEEVPQCKYVV